MDPLLVAEAAINGILLGGVLALLALGLNLIFGVVDIVWIAYVELVMLGMYAVYWLVTLWAWPVVLAGMAAVGLVAILGILVHLLIIAPILSSPPVNQLLATGGLLFFLQSFATFLWATDHRSLRLALPILEVDFSKLDPKLPKILGYESKWEPDSPYWTQVRYQEAELSEVHQQQMIEHSARLFERLGCRDYARFDFRAFGDQYVETLVRRHIGMAFRMTPDADRLDPGALERAGADQRHAVRIGAGRFGWIAGDYAPALDARFAHDRGQIGFEIIARFQSPRGKMRHGFKPQRSH